jgi:hypothetical protein
MLCAHAWMLRRTNRLDEFCVLVHTLKLIWLLLHLDPIYLVSILIEGGYAVAQLAEALRYKPEGRGFDSRWCSWNFSLT